MTYAELKELNNHLIATSETTEPWGLDI